MAFASYKNSSVDNRRLSQNKGTNLISDVPFGGSKDGQPNRQSFLKSKSNIDPSTSGKLINFVQKNPEKAKELMESKKKLESAVPKEHLSQLASLMVNKGEGASNSNMEAGTELESSNANENNLDPSSKSELGAQKKNNKALEKSSKFTFMKVLKMVGRGILNGLKKIGIGIGKLLIFLGKVLISLGAFAVAAIVAFIKWVVVSGLTALACGKKLLFYILAVSSDTLENVWEWALDPDNSPILFAWEKVRDNVWG